MSVPAPTPFRVSKYSTDSAGEAFGTPIIELLHDYYHHDADDYQPNESYVTSLIGIFASIVVLGFLTCFIVWCFNCFACCQCCRNCCRCFFDAFNGHRMRGKVFAIIIFLLASIMATTSYFGRNEFNDAVFEIGDQMRYVAEIFDDIAIEAALISDQGNTYVNASEALVCQNVSATLSFQQTSDLMVDVGKSLEGLIDGVADEIRDAADYIEEEFPPRVDLAIGVIVGLIWLNTLLGGVAILTEDLKADDWLVVVIGTITILILSIVVGAELTLATFAADFCYAVPEEMLLDEMSSGSVGAFYLTCNGTSPFAPNFESARNGVDDFFTDISLFGDICSSSPIDTIQATANATIATIDSFESITSCSRINPIFTNTIHGILCDEFVRGLFITFMVQASAAIFLFLALMVMPCAANAKPMFDSPSDVAKSMKKSNKVAPEKAVLVENEMEMIQNAEMGQAESQSRPDPPVPAAKPEPEPTSLPTPAPVVVDTVVVPKATENIHDEKSIDDEEISNVVSF